MSKLALIAGNGKLPLEIRNHCNQSGRRLLIIGLESFANPDDYEHDDFIIANIGEVGKILSALKKNKVEEIVLAGGIKRPSIKELKTDLQGLKFISELALKSSSDNTILTLIIKKFESNGYKVIGPQDVMPDLLFAEGVYGKIKPSSDDMKDIQRGIEVAKALGSVDVGQAVVVQEGIVLAVESIEGTDAVLQRANSLMKKGKAPILVKIVKPGQEKRIDFPTIGLQTIEQLKINGIKGIAVEANGILIIEKERVIKEADNQKIFIVGVRV